MYFFFFFLFFFLKNDNLRLYVPYRKPIDAEDPSKTQSKRSLNNTTLSKQQQKLSETPVPRQDYETHNPNAALSKALEPLANKWFSLRDFKRALRSIGLNIFPEADAEKYVSITAKNKKLEWQAYCNMAVCSCLLSFAFSKWNSDINDDAKIVTLYQAHTSNKEPQADDFKCLIFTQDLVYLSDSSELSEELDQNCAQKTQVSIISNKFKT